MRDLELDINLVNPKLHHKAFYYPGDFGPGRSNVYFMDFKHISEWREYLFSLQIESNRVPDFLAKMYHDSLRILFLAWVETAVIQMAEFQALRTLEAALRGVYYQPLFEIQSKKKSLTRNSLALDWAVFSTTWLNMMTFLKTYIQKRSGKITKVRLTRSEIVLGMQIHLAQCLGVDCLNLSAK